MLKVSYTRRFDLDGGSGYQHETIGIEFVPPDDDERDIDTLLAFVRGAVLRGSEQFIKAVEKNPKLIKQVAERDKERAKIRQMIIDSLKEGKK